MIPQITVEKSKENKAPGEGDLTDSSHADQLIEEESFKDTLPLNIVTGFYRSVGQNKISKGKRERWKSY